MSVRDDTIPTEYKAVTCYAPKDYKYETKPMLSYGESDILVKVGACGLCAGDAKCWAGVPMFWGDEKRAPYVQAPVTPGHEFVGTVAAIGSKVKGFSVGDSIISEQIVPCRDCFYCKKGLRWLCQPHDIYGFHQCVPGGMADYMVFPANSVNLRLPKGLPMKHLAFVEPLSCAVHGVERGNIGFGDTVVVSGCGPIGLGMVAAARLKNPARLIALDMFDSRLDVARECGADICLNPKVDDVVSVINEMTGGYGCDVYLEGTGHPSSVEQGLFMTRKMGTFVEFSVFGQKTSVDWTIIGDTKELNIHGAHLSGNSGYHAAIRMIEMGKLPLDRIVTHALPLDDFMTGIGLVTSGIESIKVVVEPVQ